MAENQAEIDAIQKRRLALYEELGRIDDAMYALLEVEPLDQTEWDRLLAERDKLGAEEGRLLHRLRGLLFPTTPEQMRETRRKAAELLRKIRPVTEDPVPPDEET